MSISTEIARIEAAKNDISAAIAEKGVEVPAGTMLDGMAALISSIDTGSGVKFACGIFDPKSYGGTSTQLYSYPVTYTGLGFTPTDVMLWPEQPTTSESSYSFLIWVSFGPNFGTRDVAGYNYTGSDDAKIMTSSSHTYYKLSAIEDGFYLTSTATSYYRPNKNMRFIAIG